MWVATETIETPERVAPFDAIWCLPASPYRNTEGALRAIRFARESGRPSLGTCGGFRHALLEYARNVLELREAAHAELEPHAELPFLAPLACSLVEVKGHIRLLPGSRLHAIYGVHRIEEEYHCRYGLNPRYETLLDGRSLSVSARDAAGEVRAVELGGQPFFILHRDALPAGARRSARNRAARSPGPHLRRRASGRRVRTGVLRSRGAKHRAAARGVRPPAANAALGARPARRYIP